MLKYCFFFLCFLYFYVILKIKKTIKRIGGQGAAQLFEKQVRRGEV